MGFCEDNRDCHNVPDAFVVKRDGGRDAAKHLREGVRFTSDARLHVTEDVAVLLCEVKARASVCGYAGPPHSSCDRGFLL
jgi:hypothetical protein